jgi:hypothetical protein
LLQMPVLMYGLGIAEAIVCTAIILIIIWFIRLFV